MAPIAFALTYGSIGDIISTAQILSNIAQTLYQTRESISKYEDLKFELNRSFSILMPLERHVLDNDTSQLEDLIKDEISCCRVTSQAFLDRLNHYRRPISSLRIQEYWGQVMWAASEGLELAHFRQNLSAHMHNLSVMLAAINCDSVRPLLCGLRNVKEVLNEVMAVVRRTTFDPHHILDHNVTVIDALGKPIPIPIEYFSSWQKLQEIMIFYFRGRSGERLVQRGDYQMLHAENNSMKLIDPLNLVSTVKGGMTIEMSAIIRRPGIYHGRGELCPRCNHPNPRSTAMNGGWMSCPNCTSNFQIHPAGSEYDLKSPASQIDLRQTVDEPEHEAEESQIYFQRIVVIHRLLRSLGELKRDHGARQAIWGTTMTSSPSNRRRSIESTMRLIKELAVDGRADSADQYSRSGTPCRRRLSLDVTG